MPKGTFFGNKSIGLIITAACIIVVLSFAFLIVFSILSTFRSGMNEAIRTQNMELSTQIVYNYENYIRSIINTSVILQTDISLIQEPGDWDGLSAFFGDVIHLNNDILNIAVFDFQTGLCLASSDSDAVGSFIYRRAAWMVEAVNNPTVHVFSGPLQEQNYGVMVATVSRSITLPDGSLGVLKIEISFQRFIELVRMSNLGEGGHITIIDQGYNIVYTSVEDEIKAAEGLGVVRELILGSRNTSINGYNLAVNVDTLSNTKWRIAVFINIDILSVIEQDFIRSAVISLFVILAGGVLVFFWVGRIITRPMKRLELAMETVESSDYFRLEEVHTSAFKEVNALVQRFNKMMQKIGELMNRVVEEQNAQRKSELKALQNQINPHFLYNTLESIIWVIEKGKLMEASRMVASLAKLFRLGLSNDNETVTLKDELEHVRNYLQIQKYRYGDSFDYEFDVDENTLGKQTIKLILQPIVENCIYHGIKSNIDRGHIRISARLESGFLVISVSDNGYGIRREAIDRLYSSFKDNTQESAVVLKNIYQRVMIYYGGKAEMIIESELDVGTTVIIKERIDEDELEKK